MKKILILASTFPRFEGDIVPKFILNYANLLKDEYEIHVLAPFAKGALTFEKMDGIFVHRFKYFFGGGGLAYGGGIIHNLNNNYWLIFQLPFFVFSQFLSLARINKRENFDLINAHWLIPQGLIAVVYKFLFRKKTKIFCTSHGTDILGLRGRFTNYLKKFVLKNINILTVVSNEMKKKVLEMNLGVDVRVGPMSVDTILFSEKKANLTLKTKIFGNNESILFVGRINEQKGLKYVIQSMPELIKKYPLLKLFIVGDGPDFECMKNLVTNKNLDLNVVFFGAIQQIYLADYFANADLFVFPSTGAEGLGLVNAEAMSCGCFVIASDLPAIRDVVIDNKTGFIVPQKDSKAITEKILYVLKNKEDLSSIKTAGRKHVEDHFSKEAVEKNYKKIIKELLGS